MDEPTLKLLTELKNTLSPVEEVRNKASEFIENVIAEEKANFLIGCINLLNSQQDMPTMHVIATNFTKSLKFTNNEELQSVQEFVLGTDQLFSACLTTAQSLVQTGDKILVNVGSELLSFLFVIDAKIDNPAFAFCQSLIANNECPLNIKICALKFFNEILSMDVFEIISKNPVYSELTGFYLHTCNEILGIPVESAVDPLVPEIKASACDILILLFEKFSSFFNLEIIQETLSVLPNSFQYPSASLFNKLHQVMFHMTKKFYLESTTFFPTIFEFVNNGLAMDDEDYLISTLNFIIDVADLEKKYIEISFSYQPNSTPKGFAHFQGLCDNSVGTWFEKLAEIILRMDPENTAVEEKGDSNVVTVSSTCIFRLFNAARSTMFALIKENFDQHATSGTWVGQYLSLIFIYACIPRLCCPCDTEQIGRIDNFNSFKKETVQWVQERIPYVISLATQSEIPQLRDTALWVLAHALKGCPDFLRAPTFQIQSENLGMVLPALEIEEGIAPYTITHICVLISQICGLYDPKAYISPINDKIFVKLFELIDSIRKSEVCVTNKYIFTDASNAMNQLCSCVNSKTGGEHFIEMIARFKSDICNVYTGSEEVYPLQREDPGIIISELCRNITFILNCPIRIDTTSFAEEVITELITIADDPDTLYFDEIMTTVMYLLRRASNFEELYTEDITEHIKAGLQSTNNESVESTCKMIRTLFQTKSDALFEQYEEYVQLLMEVIQSTESSLQTGFFVETIGAIFYYEKDKIPSEKRDEMRSDYFELIRSICELGAGQERDEDMMLYLNSLFSSVAESIKFYVYIFGDIIRSDPEIELELHKLTHNFLKRITFATPPCFSFDFMNSTLYKLLNMIQSILTVTSKKNNIWPNKSPFRRVIYIGMTKWTDKEYEIPDLAKEVLKRCKSV